APADDSQVAVQPLDGVQEDGRRAGRREGRGDLAPDDPALADPAHDDAPGRIEEQSDGVQEALVEARLECAERLGLQTNDPPCALQQLVIVADGDGSRLRPGGGGYEINAHVTAPNHRGPAGTRRPGGSTLRVP